MAARTFRAPVEEWIERPRPIAACVSDQPFGAISVGPGNASVSFLPFARTVRLRRSDDTSFVGFQARLDLSVERADSGFEARIAGYAFGVVELDEREIVAFHWHPEGASGVTHPHVHLTSRLPPIPLGRSGAVLALADAHIPTGIITLTNVVRMLIEEFGVEPRRPDWKTIVAAASADRGSE